MSMRSMHAVCTQGSLLCTAEWLSVTWPFRHLLSIDGLLGDFQFGAIVNKAVVNGNVSFCEACISSFFSKYLGV